MKEEEEKTKKKPNWALQVPKYLPLKITLNQTKSLKGNAHPWECLANHFFSIQNSLSTVSLGKLGEEGGDEGLEVEEE